MATNVAHITNDTTSVVLDDNQLILESFYERDPQVLALARETDDLEVLMHDCLAVGARALTAAAATSDVAIVEKAFGEMTSSFTHGLDEFSKELETKTSELLDSEDGILSRSLGEFADRLEELLGDTFDPESKKSAIAILEQVMEKTALEQLKATRALLDPDSDISPLNRYRNEIVKAVEKEAQKLQKTVDELKTQLAVDDARAEMFELTTKKGFTFEDELETALIEICEPQGDVAERVGGTPGARGKKGDFRVVVNPDDCGGQEICFTLEAKNQQLSLRDALKELDRCIVNRGASAGVAVFAKAEQCPGDIPFQSYGNRALVVYDPTAGNGLALRLALAWARWVVRRQLAATADSVDLDRIGSLIDAARQALRTQSTVDRALTTSANKITEARGHLGSLVVEVEAALAGIEGEISA